MFYYLNGKVTHMEENLAVIDCGGVGYACFVTATSQGRLRVGENAKLFTYCNIREELFDIYGFYTNEELLCFKMLIGVSGVGPKAALSILSVCTPDSFAMAVVTENEKLLMAAPGVGKKTAQRIVLELKDKIAKQQLEGVYRETAAPSAPEGGRGGKLAEATAALLVLGYSPAEAMEALKGLDAEAFSLEELLRQALKKLAKG